MTRLSANGPEGAASSVTRISRMGLAAVCTTLLATLPNNQRRGPVTPWVAMAIKQSASALAISTMTSAGLADFLH